MTWTCDLCGDHTDDPVDHLRLMHPDQAEPVETWADGTIVVIDSTLTPEDFA